MKYNIIQPLFSLIFRVMPKDELRGYFQWYIDVIPERINELSGAVRSTVGYDLWRPDNTPESLDLLGCWLSTQVEERPLTKEEALEIQSNSPIPREVSASELTNRTFSLAMDCGMYVSQVLLRNNPSLHWEQFFGDKKFVHRGQPVLVEFDAGPFNPTHMMVVLCYGLVDKTYDKKRLRELYDVWSNMIRS